MLDAPDHSAVGKRDALGRAGGTGGVRLEGNIVERHRLDDPAVRLFGPPGPIVAHPGRASSAESRIAMSSLSAISQQVAVYFGLPTTARQRASRTMLCKVSAPRRKLIGTGHDAEAQRTEKHRQERHPVGKSRRCSGRSSAARPPPAPAPPGTLPSPAPHKCRTAAGFRQIDDRGSVRMLPQRLIEETSKIDDLEVSLDPLDDCRRRTVGACHSSYPKLLRLYGRRTGILP